MKIEDPQALARELKELASMSAEGLLLKHVRDVCRRALAALESKLIAERKELVNKLMLLETDMAEGHPYWDKPPTWLITQAERTADRLLVSGAITRAKPLPTREEIVGALEVAEVHHVSDRSRSDELAAAVLRLLGVEGEGDG